MNIMPRYQCRKVVSAVKIREIVRQFDKTAILYPVEQYDSITVSDEFMQIHRPQPGGYYVVYGDGHKSFSPAEAFENDYALIA